MSFLPRNLICLTLAHNINDANAIERWIGEYPEVDTCIPIALRSVLETSDLPPVPFFSTSKLLQHLRIMWKNAPINNKLIEAVTDGFIYLVVYFLNNGADIHAFNNQALNSAVNENHIDIIKLLLDRGVKILASTNWLTIPIQNGRPDIVRLLLDRGANIHVNNDNTLRFAAMHGYTDMVKLLLDRKADASVLE